MPEDRSAGASAGDSGAASGLHRVTPASGATFQAARECEDADAPASRTAPAARAIGRSLRTYYAPGRAALLDAHLRRFVPAGGLAFDLGAHVGDRSASLRRLGARALAVEPQPRLARLLRLLFRHDPGVAVVQTLVGAREGRATLQLNTANPTVATASRSFVAAAAGAAGWEGQHWDSTVECPVTTIESLIRRHGVPDFIKLDVEGYEAEALRGLRTAVPAISVEFTTIARDVALDSLGLLAALGPYRFNACLGESTRFVFPKPQGAEALAAWITALPHEANSGDLYASLEPGQVRP